MIYIKVLDFEFWFFLLFYLFLRLEYYKYLVIYDYFVFLNICIVKNSKNKKIYIKIFYNFLWDMVYIYIFNRFMVFILLLYV